MSKNFNLAVIAGDGIGPEVVNEGLKILDAAGKKHGFTYSKKAFELGAAFWHKTGEVLPDKTLEELKSFDVILLGAVGDPSVPSGVLERGLLLKLRFAFDHYITRRGAERVIRDAFNRAMARPRKKLTLVHKNNVLTRAGSLWTRTFEEVAKDFPQVSTDYLHVDAASMFFVTNPERFDVVVTDNLFGDILTDIAAAICGGIGLAASGNINPSGEFPSMFEPVHGSAPDIAGKGIADPTATIMSVAMLLNHLGLTDAARDVEKAVEADLLTRADKKRSTSEIGDDLAKALS